MVSEKKSKRERSEKRVKLVSLVSRSLNLYDFIMNRKRNYRENRNDYIKKKKGVNRQEVKP